MSPKGRLPNLSTYIFSYVFRHVFAFLLGLVVFFVVCPTGTGLSIVLCCVYLSSTDLRPVLSKIKH